MKRSNDRKRKPKLLVGVTKTRSLDGERLKTAHGGACPTSRPVGKTEGNGTV